MPIEIVEFRNQEKGPALKTSAKSSVCILPISVGQKYHNKESWDQTVQLINENFAACIVVVVDSLHRFTEEMKQPLYEGEAENLSFKLQKEEEALNKALKDGEDWINAVQARWRGEGVTEKAARHIPKFTIPVSFTRWDDWTRHESYATKKEYINRMYRAPGTTPIDEAEYREKYKAPKIRKFHDLVDHTVGTFVQGFSQRAAKQEHEDIDEDLIEFDILKATELSKAYVLEELAMVEMCRSHQIPQSTLSTEVNDILNPETNFYMAYFFGQNSTNKKVLECFKSFQSETFHLLTLVDSQKKQLSQQRRKTEQNSVIDASAFSVQPQEKEIITSVRISKQDLSEHMDHLGGSEEMDHLGGSEPIDHLGGSVEIEVGLTDDNDSDPSKEASSLTSTPGVLFSAKILEMKITEPNIIRQNLANMD